MSLQRDVGNTVVARLIAGRTDEPREEDETAEGPAARPTWHAPLGLGSCDDRADAHRALSALLVPVSGGSGAGGGLAHRTRALLAILGIGRGPLQADEVEQLAVLGEELAAAIEASARRAGG